MTALTPRSLSLSFSLIFLGGGCFATHSGPVDAAPEDAAPEVDTCDPACHWDCFGGSQCIDGTVWVNAYAPRECCHFSEPWPGPGPVCGSSSHPCAGGSCVAPDPRYASCLVETEPALCSGFDDCEHLRLHCPEGTAKSPGAPCDSDADCRPAVDGVARLRCDLALVPPSCVEDSRPDPPIDYGASCGITDEYAVWLGVRIGVETVVTRGSCPLCQVMRTASCLRQGCTQSCSFDEDCPSGSICLCGGWPVVGYCAAATDRQTTEGRAAGLPACP